MIGDEGWLVGIVTDSDILQAEAAGSALRSYEPESESEWLTVGDVMTREVVTIEIGATVGELATRMIEHMVGGVPVVETIDDASRHARLVGIVTETDIFRMIADAWAAEQAHAVSA